MKLTIYRVIGGILVLTGLAGYFTWADEFRHVGEFLGVTCLWVSGIIFLLIDFRMNVFRNLALQWISFCLLACIPLGGYILDNMPIGIAIGLFLGISLAILFGRSKLTEPG